MQEAAFRVGVEQRDDDLAALDGGEGVVVRQLAREEQVNSVEAGEERAAAAGADSDAADVDVGEGGALRDGDGEALGVAEAAAHALDDGEEGLGRVEADDAAHAGAGLARDVEGVDRGAGVGGGVAGRGASA